MSLLSQQTMVLCTRIALIICLLVLAHEASAEWPPQKEPFMDPCYGKSRNTCKNECTWSVLRFPWCFNAEYLQLSPSETIDVTNNIGTALKFFTFSYGVHLSEGTMKQDYYNMLVDDCARLCLVSALLPGNNRCLSFDFYPFEDPWYSEPWLESHQAGVCTLNTGTAAVSRLRNEDQGYTDAELYYQSHFTHRPVSDLDGYYELRDARGESIGEFLEYGSGGDLSIPTINLWGRSRWGLYHLAFPDVLGNAGRRLDGDDANNNTASARDLSDIDSAAGRTQYSGGFTPVDESQRCPGKLSKKDTELLCMSAGGRLCTTKEINGLKGRKLGCSLDEYQVWAKEDKDSGTKFARCCADYTMNIDCAAYSQTSRISFCRSKLILSDCTETSGKSQQVANGFGRMLDSFRRRCASGEFGPSCQGPMVRAWYPRDQCLWCPRLGEIENAGDCRPGADYGICAYAPENFKALFGFNLWHQCGKTVSCNLKKVFPEIILPGTC